jgi:hypothetical protein
LQTRARLEFATRILAHFESSRRAPQARVVTLPVSGRPGGKSPKAGPPPRLKSVVPSESHPPKTHQTVHPRTPTETVAWAPCLYIP